MKLAGAESNAEAIKCMNAAMLATTATLGAFAQIRTLPPGLYERLLRLACDANQLLDDIEQAFKGETNDTN